MSEQAPERVAPPSRAGGGGGNVFTNKIGPLPMWAWVGIAAGILVVWRYESSKNSAASTASTAATSTAADQVPQFVNQTYTTVTAPSARHRQAGTTGSTSGTAAGDAGTATSPTDSWASLLAASGAPTPTATAAPPTPTAPQQIAKVASTLKSVTGLRATGTGATNVNLAWNPAPGAQQYQVRVTYQNNVVKTFMTNGTSYNVTGLSPNRTYGLHVVAINGSDWAPETSISQKTT